MQVHYGQVDDISVLGAPKPFNYVKFADEPDIIIDTDQPGIDIAREMSEVIA